MIEALNLLRTVLSTELAEAIPLADEHPISTYKRAINHARKAARRQDLKLPTFQRFSQAGSVSVE
jgi:hypothetical protein